MRKIIELLIDRKRAVFLILAMLYIWGSLAYINIPKEDNPSIQIPIVIVSMSQSGISAEDSERLLIKPIEGSLKSLSNVKKIESQAYFSGGHIVLHFKTDTDIKIALSDVRDKVNKSKSLLPKDADEPEITEINLSEGDVLGIAIFGDATDAALSSLARDLRDRIKEIPEILDAKIIGSREEQGQIIIDPKEILNRNINLSEILNVIASNNDIQAIGKYNSDSGRHGIQINSIIKNIDDIRDIPVQINDKYVLTLGDVADIRLGLEDQLQIAKINGKKVIGINVKKKSSANIISTIDAVKKIVANEKQYWPKNISSVYSLDTSDEIKESISSLENTVILTIILSIIPIILSIGLRSALLVAFSIPTSFLFGVLLIDMLGYTMNVVVIFSLILSVGMLVDASIVVCEYAESRISEGISPKDSYCLAASKMWWPVFSSTVTTLIVYLPLFVWPGVIGKFMYFMPLTILATVTGSLIVAYSFVPVIGASLATKKQTTKHENSFGPFQQKIIDSYERYLHKVLDRPLKFASSIGGVLVVVLVLFGAFGAGFEFFPNIEPKVINIEVNSKDSLSLPQIGKIVKNIEDILQQKFSHEIKIAYSNYWSESSSNDSGTVGLIALQMTHWKNRRNGDQIMSDIRKSLADIYGVQINVSGQKDGPPGIKPLMLNLSSADPNLLESGYKKIMTIIERTEGLVDVRSNFDQNQFEWKLSIDKIKAAKYGADARLVGNFVQMITKGLKLTTYRPEHLSKETDIVAKFTNDKRTLESLNNLYVNGKNGPVAITNFVTIKPVKKVQSIYRINGQRAITIDANIKNGIILDNKIKEIFAQITDLQIDPRVKVKFAGEKEDMDETSNFLQNAFILALLSMFLVMLIQFNSYYETVVIMTAVFLSTTGVLLGLLLTNQPFGVVMCGLGIIALAGVVVNNNIIFIDCYKQLIQNGMETRAAIIETGKTRIRPILLTAITAVLGLLPMVIGFDIDFLARELNINSPSNQWWAQLSTTICGGLTFATILTLFFTPALLMLEHRFKSFIYQRANLLLLRSKK